MLPDEHDEGFEKERKFRMVFAQARSDCPVLKARSVTRIIAHFAPEFVEGLFEPRPCVRTLRYIGCGCEERPCPHGDDFFVYGQVYESIDFNGGTYTIKGYAQGKERIGAAYFEVVKEEEPTST